MSGDGELRPIMISPSSAARRVTEMTETEVRVNRDVIERVIQDEKKRGLDPDRDILKKDPA